MRHGLPAYHLDEVARDSVTGTERTIAERREIVAKIALRDEWVTEGIYLGWTRVLFLRADLIVWLDDVTSPSAMLRVLRRFIQDAADEFSRQPGRRKFLRFRDYYAHLVELGRAFGEIAHYWQSRAGMNAGERRNDPSPSRSETLDELSAYEGKLVHYRGDPQSRRLLHEMLQSVSGHQTPS